MCIGGKDSSVNVEVVFVESGEQSVIIAILSSLTALREISRYNTVGLECGASAASDDRQECRILCLPHSHYRGGA